MTISSTHRSDTWPSNGSATVFPYTFFIFLSTHLKVTVTSPTGAGTVLVLSPDGTSQDYTVQGVLSSGGTITLLNNGQAWIAAGNLAIGWSITIARLVPYTQLTNVRGEGRYNPEIHENEYDLIVMALQQIGDLLSAGGAGGFGLSDALPQPLGTPNPGTSILASRGDHVHQSQDLSGAIATAEAFATAADATLKTTLQARKINTTAPLTGGGDLTADRTLAASVFIASGASHATGIVPDPGAVTGTSKFLREDASFAIPNYNVFMYGGGADGSLTLVAGAVFSQYQWAHEYLNVNLAGFTLTSYVAAGAGNPTFLLFVSGTLTLGGGTITSGYLGNVVPGTGGNGGSVVIGGGGGTGIGAVYVFARNIADTGTIHSNGGDGVTSVTTGTYNGSGGGGTNPIGPNNGIMGTIINATSFSTAGGPGGTNAGGGLGGAGGAGGVGPNATTNSPYGTVRDVLSIIMAGNGLVLADGQTGHRVWWSSPASGGGGGTSNNGGTKCGGAGGGGGAGSLVVPAGAGGAGGAGGSDSGGLGSQTTGGGGGGGGGSGALVCVVCNTAGAGLIISSNGGGGGGGGSNSGGAGGGGGGGGGGCGGRAIYAGPSGPTVTASAGAVGIAGIGAASGTNGTIGTAGLVSAMYN